MISVQHLSKRFGAQSAVEDLSFEVPAGQIVGFLGPNGAGKSTTLKMLTGMLTPSSGSATLCGFDLLREPLEVKRRVGFVPDSGAVFESLTGLEYLEMIAALYGIPRQAALPRIEQFISFFDLSMATLTEKLLGAYSKGMRRKVVIIAGLLHNPSVVFFDEPLDGLDANWQATDIFHAAPLLGPAPIFRGARWAVLVVLGLPAVLLFGALAWLVGASRVDLSLLLPGLIALPAYLLLPCLDGNAVPFSRPADDARGASRSARMIAVMLLSLAIAPLAVWARSGGWLWWLVLVEALAVVALCVYLRSALAAVRWATLE